MARKPETTIVNAIQAWVEEQGGYVLKLHGNALQRKGEPDLIGGMYLAGEGFPFVCEVKMPGEEPTDLQKHRLIQWEDVGYYSFWVSSLEEFTEFVADVRRRRYANNY